MLRCIFKTLFKLLFALGIVAAAVAVFKYLEEQKADYIEIYDDDLDGELFE